MSKFCTAPLGFFGTNSNFFRIELINPDFYGDLLP